MEQLKRLYASLSSKRRLAIVSALAVTLAALGLVKWQAAASFKPLYTSLSPEDAGAVIQKLKEAGTEYQLADNGATILVPVDNVAESRLNLALAGLPKTGRIGFELFDRTNLGVTEFAEHINYQRALEGELERSVMSLTEVEQARVHVTFAKDSVFSESREPAKASVLLKLRPGVEIAPRSVVAISHLIASAVEGLAPQSVSVLDMYGNLLSRPRSGSGLDSAQASDVFVEYQQSLEKSLTEKINATLEPLLGAGKFRAGVSVDCDFSSSEQSEESFNFEQSVVMTSQVSEEAAGGNSATGIPGTASALPRPRSEGTILSPGVSRRTENTAYQSSRTVRRVKTPQGTVKRISAAVLVDYALQLEGEGGEQKRTLQPRPPDKMDAIKELVGAAIGLDTSRGDQLIVQTLPFEMTLQLQKQDLAPAAPASDPSSVQQLVERLKQDPILLTVAAGAVVLLLGAGFWLMRRSRKKKARVETGKAQPALPPAQGSETHAGELAEEGAASRIAHPHGAAGLHAGGATSAPRLLSARHESLVREVHEIVAKDTELSAGIIHGWMVEEGET